NLSPASTSSFTAAFSLSFVADPGARNWPGGPDPAGGLACGNTPLSCSVTIAPGISGVGITFNQATVAGTWTARLTSLSAGLPTPSPSVATFNVPLAAPLIDSVKIINISSTGFTVSVAGSATSRDVTSSHFDFTAADGATLNGTSFDVDFGDAAQVQWF